jgi:hypothetical protein
VVNGIKREEKEVVGGRYAGEKRVGGEGGRQHAHKVQLSFWWGPVVFDW